MLRDQNHRLTGKRGRFYLLECLSDLIDNVPVPCRMGIPVPVYRKPKTVHILNWDPVDTLQLSIYLTQRVYGSERMSFQTIIQGKSFVVILNKHIRIKKCA